MKIIALTLILLLSIMAAYAVECDYKAEILLESNEFMVKDFKFKMKAAKIEGPSTNVTGRITISDENGNMIKGYKPWANSSISKQKTSSEYSPNLNEGIYMINAEISVLCDDFDNENNADSRKITIKPLIAAETAAVEVASSNENPKENGYPALFVDNNESDETTTIQSPAIEESSYTQNQEGSKEEINFQNQIAARENEINQRSTENPATGEIIYESSNEKSKELVIYLLLGVSIILNILLIWKNKSGMP